MCFHINLFISDYQSKWDREKTTGLPANKESSKVDGTQSLFDDMKNHPPQRGKGDDKDKVDKKDTKKSKSKSTTVWDG